MIIPHHGAWPKFHETAFIAPTADLIGDVEIGEESSVWFHVVIRGDVHWIKIGKRTNIQDQSLLHVSRRKSPLKIGDDVTVGHRVVLHGCTIGNRVLIGMGAIVMDDAVIGDDCIVGAGALVTKETKVMPGHLVMGVPAKVVRALTALEMVDLKQSALNYVSDSRGYMSYLRGPARLGQDDQADLETLELSDVEGDDLGDERSDNGGEI